jgi:lysophospholipase L1-like esterase
MEPFLTKMFLGLLLVIGITPIEKKKTRIWLVGDSTCADKQVRAFPETGWGMPFSTFFDSGVQVNNRAVNGRSTKSFIAENRWQQVLDSLTEGDYVFIQFGHNDEVIEKVGRYTTPVEFATNLRRYVMDTRSKKAIPILLTPVGRRTFDSVTTKIRESHPVYADTVRKVAISEHVPLIDVDAKSMMLYASAGPETSKLFF